MKTCRWGLLGVLLACGAAMADSWAPPAVRAVASEEGGYIARIVPARKGQPARASLYRHDAGTDDYRKVAAYLLEDRIAPAGALVRRDGTLITLDSWGALGEGIVLRVYDPGGKLRFARDLPDLLGKDAARVPRTVSSRWWRCGEPLLYDGGDTLRIGTWDQGEVRIDLRSGKSEYAPGDGKCR